jgi:hypothetical protein
MCSKKKDFSILARNVLSSSACSSREFIDREPLNAELNAELLKQKPGEVSVNDLDALSGTDW